MSRRISLWLSNSGRVSGSVVGDLKPQELVDGGQRFGIGSGNPNAAATVDLLEAVLDVALEPLQDGNAGRRAVVNEHRGLEVALGEQGRNVPQMHADLVAAGAVFGVVRGDLDRPAVGKQAEVVRGLLVR